MTGKSMFFPDFITTQNLGAVIFLENKNKDKDNKEKNDINEKEKADKPKRVKNSLKKLRGIDI